jgi:hypothetical protein
MSTNRIKKHSDFGLGYPGTVADGSPKYARSYAIELDPGDDYSAGKVLLFGTDPAAQVKLTETGDTVDFNTFAGFGLADRTKERPQPGGVQYLDGDLVSVLQFGVLNVTAGEAVTAGETVVCQVNGGALLGKAADAALLTGEFRIPGARWITSTASGAVGQITVGMGAGSLGYAPVGAVSGSQV